MNKYTKAIEGTKPVIWELDQNGPRKWKHWKLTYTWTAKQSWTDFINLSGFLRADLRLLRPDFFNQFQSNSENRELKFHFSILWKSNRFINRKIKLNSNLIRRIRSSSGRVHDLNMICINWIKFENSCFVHFYLSNHAPNSKPIRKEDCTWILSVPGFIKLVLMISKSRDVFLIRTSCIEMDVDSKCWKIRGVPKILKRPKFQNFRQNWLGLESAGNWGWFYETEKGAKRKFD